MIHTRRATFLGALFLLACGRTSPLLDLRGGGPGGDAGADAHGDGGGEVGPPCTWVRAARAVLVSTDPEVPGNVRLHDAVPTVGGALVTWTTPHDATRPDTAVTRYVAYDSGALRDPHVVLPGLLGSFLDNVAVAQGYGHAGIVGFDTTACRFHPLTLDGASNGAPATPDRRRCGGLTATARGFDLLVLVDTDTVRSAQILLSPLDPSGAVLGAPVTLFTSPTGSSLGPVTRTTFDDGSFLVARMVPGRSTHPTFSYALGMNARHFDANGTPLAPETTIVSRPDVVRTVQAIAGVGGGAMAAWFVAPEAGGPNQLSVAPLDRDGRPTRDPVAIMTSDAKTHDASAVAIAADAGGGALLGWIERTASTSMPRLVPVTAEGEPRGPTIEFDDAIPATLHLPIIRLVTSGASALVIVQGGDDPHRVYAVPLSCVR